MFHNCISIVLYKLNTHTCLWPLVHNIHNVEEEFIRIHLMHHRECGLSLSLKIRAGRSVSHKRW